MQVSNISQFNQQNYSSRSKNKQQAFGIHFNMDKKVASDFFEEIEFFTRSNPLKKDTFVRLGIDGENFINKIYKDLISHNKTNANHLVFDGKEDIRRVSLHSDSLGGFTGFDVATDKANVFVRRPAEQDKIFEAPNVTDSLQNQIESQILKNRREALNYLAEKAAKSVQDK